MSREGRFREVLAELCHEQWSGWMEYVFDETRGALLPTPAWVVGTESYQRWRRQMKTSYDDLSEREKDSDRIEADKFLALFAKENVELKTQLVLARDSRDIWKDRAEKAEGEQRRLKAMLNGGAA